MIMIYNFKKNGPMFGLMGVNNSVLTSPGGKYKIDVKITKLANSIQRAWNHFAYWTHTLKGQTKPE